MTTLINTIRANGGKQAPALIKHLTAVGIKTWKDCTKTRLSDLRDHLTASLAPASARTYLASLKAILYRYEDEGVIPCHDFAKILHGKNDLPVKTFLTRGELNELAKVDVLNQNERFVLYSFLVGAYTGMRVSDARAVSPENIHDGYLTYVSIKTGVHATVPCSARVAEYITWLRGHDSTLTLAAYNLIIRRLCKRAGLTERVKVRHGGVDAIKEKWECVSSHTARVSFVTNLSLLNVPLIDISRMAGHSSTAMSERYVARYEVKLDMNAMAYFGI